MSAPLQPLAGRFAFNGRFLDMLTEGFTEADWLRGALVFGGTWPAGIPSGLPLYFQTWADDPTDLVPANLLSINAVQGIAH